MKWNKNIETFLGCQAGFEEAEMVIFGAPFDSTTSYRPGTRFASATMRHESYGLETYSPYQDLDLCDFAIFDGGDLELPFGDSEMALQQIEEAADQIVTSGKLPCMIGGEHLVTLGAFRSVLKKYPDLVLIQLDAHTDLREDYLGVKLSHACVVRRCYDLIGDGRIYQFGIRSGLKEEFYWAREHTHLQKFNFDGLEEVVDFLVKTNVPVYFTIDLDVLDPSVFPGTGTPEAGGVSFMDLLDAIHQISRTRLVGMDVNELSPLLDASGASTAVACKVLRELSLAVLHNRKK